MEKFEVGDVVQIINTTKYWSKEHIKQFLYSTGLIIEYDDFGFYVELSSHKWPEKEPSVFGFCSKDLKKIGTF